MRYITGIIIGVLLALLIMQPFSGVDEVPDHRPDPHFPRVRRWWDRWEERVDHVVENIFPWWWTPPLEIEWPDEGHEMRAGGESTDASQSIDHGEGW